MQATLATAVKEDHPDCALSELTRIHARAAWCDFAAFAIDHYPIDPDFDREVRRVMTALVDCDIGRLRRPRPVSAN
jgi:hypothetical protein